MKATITLSRSSHPEFEYFGDMRVNGRQLSTRTNDLDELNRWAARGQAAAERHGATAEIENKIS